MIRPIPELGVGGTASGTARRANAPTAHASFAATLDATMAAQRDVRFSAHALKRLEDRAIQISAGDHGRIRDAVDQLRAKGGRESLLVMERVALVVNVPNRTVITAVPTDELNSSVFTQIDSAVVVGSPAAIAPPTHEPLPQTGRTP